MVAQDWNGEFGRLVEALRADSDAEARVMLADERVQDIALEKVFEGVVDSFRPDRAQGKTAIVHYRILMADDIRNYTVRVEDDRCVASSGSHGESLFTISMELIDFIRLSIGKLSGFEAFMSGRLKATGDLLAAQSYQRWFEGQ